MSVRSGQQAVARGTCSARVCSGRGGRPTPHHCGGREVAGGRPGRSPGHAGRGRHWLEQTASPTKRMRSYRAGHHPWFFRHPWSETRPSCARKMRKSPVVFVMLLCCVSGKAWCQVRVAGKLVGSGNGRGDVEVAMSQADPRSRRVEERRKREAEETERYVERIMADAPPLDEEQTELLREILGPSFRAWLQRRRARLAEQGTGRPGDRVGRDATLYSERHGNRVSIDAAHPSMSVVRETPANSQPDTSAATLYPEPRPRSGSLTGVARRRGWPGAAAPRERGRVWGDGGS
ncbi:MAG: hypothetical protein QG671_1476 [Actinomycetota bacterium]|nr:hypothetical protein [Actinomycetota bacterium]